MTGNNVRTRNVNMIDIGKGDVIEVKGSWWQVLKKTVADCGFVSLGVVAWPITKGRKSFRYISGAADYKRPIRMDR
ncbi:hypothetical protein SAMN05192558_113132 [Actinokineospora alba]|uniref:Uncharacterized protein n=1 Tax=Actinokineospora alba TaxID=504798 RepID=A0A1H0VAS4_9PSEU|nr:hypothetical protein [Actinokineospora alba]TDP65579.1 hypothetical protein C8E96_1065 [Actinokineospora alba]SDH65917.1 hypothetical protein SAMN05421871_101886 [Actinokineospora alba]SDP75335.1 hypothetical protein SAMN05192558_113132 [Actinokineospora alba]